MKRAIALLALAFSVTSGQSAFFQNLGFESPTFVPIGGLPWSGGVDPVQALPGWTTYVGDIPATFILHDNYFLDSAGVSILDSVSGVQFVPFDGQYTLLLQGGFSLAGYPYVRFSAAIAQTALIPSIDRWLTFETSGGVVVSVGGVTLPQLTLSSGPGYLLQAVDISAFSGTTEELRFTSFPNPPPGLAIHNVFLDGLHLTSTIPEPSSWILLLGLLVVRAFRLKPR